MNFWLLNCGRDSLVMIWLLVALAVPVGAKAAAPVTVTDNGRTWTLDNGVVKAVINRRNGAMESLF